MALRAKISELWENPYAAPLIEPLNSIGRVMGTFLSSYTEAARDALNDRYLSQEEKNKSRYMRFFANLFSLKNPLTLFNVAGLVLTGSFAASFGGFTAYGAMAGSGALLQTAATAAGVITAGTIGGVILAPLALVTTVGVAGLAAGAVVGGVPGVVKGAVKAYQWHTTGKQAHLANTAMAAAPAAPVQRTEAQEIVSRFVKLSPEKRAEVIQQLEESYVRSQKSRKKHILAQIDKLDDAHRIALVETLQSKLGDAFDVVATRRAVKAGQLSEDIAIKPIATKLRRAKSKTPDTAAGA